MVPLTTPQVDLLFWMVESGLTSFVLSEGYGPASVIGAGGPGGEFSVDASDFRELEAQGLIRHASGETYDLTNRGRVVYGELKTPPAQPRPGGFQPAG